MEIGDARALRNGDGQTASHICYKRMAILCFGFLQKMLDNGLMRC